MEKMLATFLKAMGISPEVMMQKAQEIFGMVESVKITMEAMRADIAALRRENAELRSLILHKDEYKDERGESNGYVPIGFRNLSKDDN